MRKNIVAGNWKMNKNFREAEELLYDLADLLAKDRPEEVGIIVCPPAVYLEMALDVAHENEFFVGAQNASQFSAGAYTGEISPAMLKSMNVDYCILGHSERRKYFHETNELLAAKVKAAIENDLAPIFCCGEVLPEREANTHFEVVKQQLEAGLFHLAAEDFEKVILAYEPVWAIGTGVTASPEQAQEMHAYIRQLVAEKYGSKMADEVVILYGGSCNAKNARALFANPDVDGGLIGGASLVAADFVEIIKSFK